ncbi:hypothetical protein [Pseudovibrio sp. SPO723]|uniref:hypothetical protein n=1 Tax=Nesiotobacter zosterae TaxID=392721 RepID=UPI0029C18D62|nr:hypothetical protein [Pseudovibrio sp. SPO723]MDX5593855.1 hypothetical protein [Pseudovibrio sp. SPO723]
MALVKHDLAIVNRSLKAVLGFFVVLSVALGGQLPAGPRSLLQTAELASTQAGSPSAGTNASHKLAETRYERATTLSQGSSEPVLKAVALADGVPQFLRKKLQLAADQVFLFGRCGQANQPRAPPFA